jgi:hypothetical protein
MDAPLSAIKPRTAAVLAPLLSMVTVGADRELSHF